MNLTLKDPFIITGGLCPGIRIGEAILKYDNGFVIQLDDKAHVIEDYTPGCGDFQSQFADILGFLSYWVESIQYTTRTGEPGEHNDLFDKALATWALENADDISILSFELEKQEGLLIFN